MCLKLPDTQLFLGRTGCHSHLNKPRAINSQGFGLATSATLRKNTVSNYNNCQTNKVQRVPLTCPGSKKKKKPNQTHQTKNPQI